MFWIKSTKMDRRHKLLRQLFKHQRQLSQRPRRKLFKRRRQLRQ